MEKNRETTFIVADFLHSVFLFGMLFGLLFGNDEATGNIGLEIYLLYLVEICIIASLVLEICGTFAKNLIAMIAALVLTAILFGLFVYYVWGCYVDPIPRGGAFFTSILLAVWNLARFTFQIKVIQSIHADAGWSPLLPQKTENGYQSI